MKSCLHICNDFAGSKVYRNLYLRLSGHLDQTVFMPVRKSGQKEKAAAIAASVGVDLITSKKLQPWHRVFFRSKINSLLQDLHPHMKAKPYDLIHATTLYSDGALAYRLAKKYNIKYYITVRGTDINLFLRYRPDLTGLAKKIIENAEALVFISNAHLSLFNTLFQKLGLDAACRKKMQVIPNGIDDFWLSNIKAKHPLPDRRFNVLYIGKFNSNKNLPRLIKAVERLREKVPYAQLHLIGGKGNQEKQVIEMAASRAYVNYHGEIYDLEKLIGYFRNNDVFAMVSKSETFGLVYVEALSQGLPIVFTKGQGIDGTFSSRVGHAADPWEVDSITKALEEVFETYSDIDLTEIQLHRFDWKNISKEYLRLYKSAPSIKETSASFDQGSAK